MKNRPIISQNKLCFTYYLIFSILALVNSLQHPTLNWDMIGYVAVAKSYKTDDINKLHSEVYDGLKNFVSKQQYKKLISFNKKRNDVYNSPELLSQHLPFYSIRPIYTGLIYSLSIIGINEYKASYVIPALFTTIGFLLIFFSLYKIIPLPLLYSIPILLTACGALSLFRLSTPDGIVFFYTSLLSFFILRKKSNIVLCLLPLAILIRTDLIIFIIMVGIWLFFKKINFLKLFISICLSCIFFLGVNHFSGNYGWNTLIYYSFIERPSNPESINVVLSFKEYISIHINQFHKYTKNSGFMFFIGLSLITYYLVNSKKIRLAQQPYIHFFLFAPLCYVLVHVMLFPAVWHRFFIGFYYMIILSLLLTLSELAKPDLHK